MMPPQEQTLAELRRQEYNQRIIVDRLRREVFQQTDPVASTALLGELTQKEKALKEIEAQRAAVQAKDAQSGLILDTADATTMRGRDTTGLEAKVHLKMAHVPTAICHLLDREQNPLIACQVKAVRTADRRTKRRLRVSSYIEGYSARAVNTFELPINSSHTVKQLPTLFPASLRSLSELTRATLNVLVEDLEGDVELHETEPIWLLARTSAPLFVDDPQSGQRQDLTPYFGAFVTPNAPSLMKFLRIAADFHPEERLVGYQGDPDGVNQQVKALFDALKSSADITYVNSVIDFNPNQGTASQRVRLPRESLADREANCLDGTVLFASLLEGISLHPAIILVPGHAFLGWETWSNTGEWCYLETTMIGSSSFEEACDRGSKLADHYASEDELTRLPLQVLRSVHGITPME
jgi:hypothetical protein